MKLEKNKEKVLTFRVSEENYIKFVFLAKTAGISPSKLLRYYVELQNLGFKELEEEGQVNYEDAKKVVDDYLQHRKVSR